MRMAQAAPVHATVAPPGRMEPPDPWPSSSLPFHNPDESAMNTVQQIGNQGPLSMALTSSPQLHQQTSSSHFISSGKPPESRSKWKIFTSSMSRKDSTIPSITSPIMQSDRGSSILTMLTRDSASHNSPLDGVSANTKPDVSALSNLSSGPNSGSMSGPQYQPTRDSVLPASWTSPPELAVDEGNPWASETSMPIESRPKRPSTTVSGLKPLPQLDSRSSARNPYGGFCKGAYKLQVGLTKESVKLRNQSTSMTGQSNYFACASSKCAFEGPALKSGKTWIFDDEMRRSNAIQYRWTFLAKSHVALSKVKNREYNYQCVFCERKDEAMEVYRSEKTFIEHVAMHRDQDSLALLTDKVCCITGRKAVKEEAFDINLMSRENEM